MREIEGRRLPRSVHASCGILAHRKSAAYVT